MKHITGRKRAFTLVEMMAVVVIIGILAAVIAPRFFGQVNQAQVVAAQQDIENIKKAVTFFKFHTNKFPEDLRDLQRDPDIKGWQGPYLDKVPRDPWDNEYQYVVPGGDNRDFDVWSYGADEVEGGDGMDADITSWEQAD